MPTPLKDHPKGPPGSTKAHANGCRCPILDNNHGQGMYLDEDGQPVYAVSRRCPIHDNGKDSMTVNL